MKKTICEKLTKLKALLIEAKEIQAELVSDSGKELTTHEREEVVKIWNGLDKAGLALHHLCESRKKNKK